MSNLLNARTALASLRQVMSAYLPESDLILMSDALKNLTKLVDNLQSKIKIAPETEETE